MSLRNLLIAAAALAAATSSWAQGALKPLETLVVNPESRPVPVEDRKVAAAVAALAASENRRSPYQHASRFNQGMDTCTQFVCEVTFPAVPAGKLLVVTYASARYASTAANVFPNVELRTSNNPNDTTLLPAPAAVGPGSFITAGPVTFHVPAGRSPVLALGGIGVGLTSNTALASVVGYLIDAP